MQIYKFNSILKPVLWGGDKLLTFKRLPACDEPIGESWELSALQGRESVVSNGDEAGMTLPQLLLQYGADLVGKDVYRRYGDSFPLLIKLIDAKRDLSIQVHPDEEMARANHGCSGKNEMWYILHADDGAIIRTGFNHDLTPEEFDLALGQGEVLNVINATASHPGDVFFIPAGQIHAIGAGNLVVEIQQSCDITYRVWDYNRRDADGNLRQLHTQEAREALSFKAFDGFTAYSPSEVPGLTPLVCCHQFEVCRLDFDDGFELPMTQPHSFMALVCLEGNTTLMVDGMSPVTLCQGETALVPAIAQKISMLGTARLLMATVPPAEQEDINC